MQLITATRFLALLPVLVAALALVPPVAALNPDGIAVYQQNTSNNIHADNFTGTGFTASDQALQDVGGEPRFLIIKSSWDRPEAIVVSHDSANDLNVVVLNTTDDSTVFSTEFTGAAPNVNFRTIDVAYEYESGRALVVWDSNTNDQFINYSVWDGTSFVENNSIALPSLSTTRRFLKLTPRPGSNDIMLVYNDGLNDISAILWNGSTWGSGLYATASGTAVSSRRPMDFAWMQNGDGVFFYSHAPGSPNNGVYYQYFTYANTSWGPQTVAMLSTTVTTATTRQVEACANPQNDYVGVVFQDSSADAYSFMWNGTAVETSPSPPTQDTSTESAGDNAECEWESNGRQAIFIIVDNNALSLSYYTYDLSPDLQTRSWSTATMEAAPSTGNIGADDIESVTTDSHPTNDTIMVVFKDLLFHVNSTLWNGSELVPLGTNSELETASTGGPTASATVQSFSYSWVRTGRRPPVFQGVVDDTSDDAAPTNEGDSVIFNGTAVEPYGDDWYLLVCGDTDVQDGQCGASGEICQSAAVASGSEANCTHDTSGETQENYNWYAYACSATSQACSAYDFTNSPYAVNHAPYSEPYLSTYAPTVSDTITCFANATDPDSGDSIVNVFAWYQQNESNGSFTLLLGETGNQLSAPQFDSNDHILCAVTPTDVHGFAAAGNNTSAAVVQNGTLSASSSLAAPQIYRTQSTTINVSCSMTGGDAEDVILTVQDNSSGSFAQSSTTPAAVYVDVASFDLGRLASETAPNQTVTIYTQTAGNYSFRARCSAADADGSPVGSSPENLEVIVDTTPPVISNAEAIDVTSNTATVVWDTDDSADSQVDYGQTPSLGSSVFDPSLSTTHNLLLISLNKTTLYYFNVTSCNVDGYCSTDGPFSFSTTTSDDETSGLSSGSCTGTYRENGSDHQDGYLSKDDVFSFYCELPNRVYETEQFTVTLTNNNKQMRKTLAVPSTLIGTTMAVYP